MAILLKETGSDGPNNVCADPQLASCTLYPHRKCAVCVPNYTHGKDEEILPSNSVRDYVSV